MPASSNLCKSAIFDYADAGRYAAFSDEGSRLFTGPDYGAWEGEGGLVRNEDHTECEYVTPEGYNGKWDYMCKEISPLAAEFQDNSRKGTYGEVCGIRRRILPLNRR